MEDRTIGQSAITLMTTDVIRSDDENTSLTTFPNVSEWPSRVHDPSDIRDKTMTDLLTTAVQERTHRDEMMTQRDPWETDSKIQDENGTPCATSLETGCKHHVGETGTVTTRKSPGEKQNEPFTDIASRKATDVKSDKAGNGSEKESDATSTTEEDAETKKWSKRLERPVRG